jgi:hypothetical protein
MLMFLKRIARHLFLLIQRQTSMAIDMAILDTKMIKLSTEFRPTSAVSLLCAREIIPQNQIKHNSSHNLPQFVQF